jgi:hypothetical protein
MATDLIDPQVTPKPAPTTGSKEQQVLEWAKDLLKEGQMRRRHWEGIWWQNIAFFMGDFWTEWDVHTRRLVEPVQKPLHRVRLPINLAQPAVRTELAKLTKNRPIIDTLARSSDQEDLNSAKVGDKMLNNYVEKKFHMPRVRKKMLNWVLMCGLGGILTDWDETALGEIEVLHDKEGNPIFDPKLIEEYKAKYEQDEERPNYKKIPMGEMITKAVSPFALIWDFSTNDFHEAAWCIFSDVYDVDEVKRRWNVDVESDSDAIPGIIENRLMNSMDLTGKLGKERPVHAQKMAVIHQMWIKPGHVKFPNGLCLVFNKTAVLKFEDYNYGHGELPIEVMSHIELPTSQHAMSVLQQLRAPVLELSKTKSQLIENRNLMANPPWLIAKQLQVTKEIQNRPGLRIEFTFMPNIPPPKPVEMPEMPKYVVELVAGLKEDIREISGQGETSQGKVPPGARSGVAIAYLQEEDDTRLGPTVADFEETMEGVAYKQLRLMAEKYDTPRTVSIYKVNGEPEVFDFVGTMLSGAAGVQCRAGSALPRSKAAKQQYILDLWDRKLEQDPRKVRQMLELGEGEPDEWEVDLDQAERENHELKEGDDPGVQEWYNHPAHHYMHRNYMKSGDFKKQPEEIQQLFMHHDEEHTHMEQQQAAEMAANQAGGQQPQGGGQGGAPPPLGSSAPAGANGQTNVQGPPSQFTSASSPRTLMEGGPQ